MGPGVTLIVLGAILTFAVRAEARAVDLQTVGLILMIAGAAIVYHAQRSVKETVVKAVHEDSEDPEEPAKEIEERTVHERAYGEHGVRRR